MKIRKAIEIFENISLNQYTDEEKVIAIYEVMNMPTHMSIKKETILNALKWLWHSAYEVETEEKETVGAEKYCKECLHYSACKGTYCSAKGDESILHDFDGEMYADSGCEDYQIRKKECEG